jgi:hypothetical protein
VRVMTSACLFVVEVTGKLGGSGNSSLGLHCDQRFVGLFRTWPVAK